jgi:hypothetical protein
VLFSLGFRIAPRLAIDVTPRVALGQDGGARNAGGRRGPCGGREGTRTNRPGVFPTRRRPANVNQTRDAAPAMAWHRRAGPRGQSAEGGSATRAMRRRARRREHVLIAGVSCAHRRSAISRGAHLRRGGRGALSPTGAAVRALGGRARSAGTRRGRCGWCGAGDGNGGMPHETALAVAVFMLSLRLASRKRGKAPSLPPAPAVRNNGPRRGGWETCTARAGSFSQSGEFPFGDYSLPGPRLHPGRIFCSVAARNTPSGAQYFYCWMS